MNTNEFFLALKSLDFKNENKFKVLKYALNGKKNITFQTKSTSYLKIHLIKKRIKRKISIKSLQIPQFMNLNKKFKLIKNIHK